MTLALLGEGEMLEGGRKVPAAEALAKPGSRHCALPPRRGWR